MKKLLFLAIALTWAVTLPGQLIVGGGGGISLATAQAATRAILVTSNYPGAIATAQLAAAAAATNAIISATGNVWTAIADAALSGSGDYDSAGIYVDSLLGDDAATGRAGDPIRTLARANILATNYAAPHIWLRRDRVWREAWYVPDNAHVRSYASGVRPVVSGATFLTNSLFSLAAGKSNTYAYAISPAWETNTFAEITHNDVLKVWDNNIRLKGGGGTSTNVSHVGVAAVESAPGSAWYDTTNRILYVHLADHANPARSSRVLEASVRTMAVYVGTNCIVEDLIGEKAYALTGGGSQGYGILAKAQALVKNCVGRYGWNHNIGTANYFPLPPGTELRFENCVAYDCESQNHSSPTMFVAFKQTTPASTNIVVFTNCYSYQPSLSGESSMAFLAHGDHVKAYVDGCSGINVNTAFPLDGALQSRGAGLSASNCIYGVIVSAGTGLTNASAINVGVGIAVRTTNGWHRDLRVRNATHGIALDRTNGWVNLTNHFSGVDTSKSINNIISFEASAYNWITVSNSYFNTVDYCYDSLAWQTVGTQDALIGADFNNYCGTISRWGSAFNTPPTQWTSFATWRAAFPAFDANSTTVDRPPSAFLVRSVPPAEETGLTDSRGRTIRAWEELQPVGLTTNFTQGGITWNLSDGIITSVSY